jgi:hypothetical protein
MRLVRIFGANVSKPPLKPLGGERLTFYELTRADSEALVLLLYLTSEITFIVFTSIYYRRSGAAAVTGPTGAASASALSSLSSKELPFSEARLSILKAMAADLSDPRRCCRAG